MKHLLFFRIYPLHPLWKRCSNVGDVAENVTCENNCKAARALEKGGMRLFATRSLQRKLAGAGVLTLFEK